MFKLFFFTNEPQRLELHQTNSLFLCDPLLGILIVHNGGQYLYQEFRRILPSGAL